MSEPTVWQVNVISERGSKDTQLTNPSESDPIVMLVSYLLSFGKKWKFPVFSVWIHGYFRIPMARRNSSFGQQI